MYRKVSIIISVILVTAAILTVQSSSLSMLQNSYAQLCPDGSPPDASGNCATAPPPAGDGETTQAPPPATTETIDDGSFAVIPPPAEAPPATETTPPATEAPPAGAYQEFNTGIMTADWANSILAMHNSERAAVGVPPLVWSDTLAASAQAWAEHLATMKEFVHSHQHGENIAGFDWEGPTAPYGVSLWVAEKQYWQGGVLTEENWAQAGHYLQMVSRNAQEVGCGTAPPGPGGPPWNTLVCQYEPWSNVIGQPPY